jgi:hypothetical protein
MRLSLEERRTREHAWCRVAGNPGWDDKGKRDDSIGVGLHAAVIPITVGYDFQELTEHTL